jgi:hypothetical protein
LICIWGDFAPDFLKKNLNYQRGAKGYLFSRILEVKSVGNVDVLFIGSSHSYRGFDTRIFKKYDINSFNLGSSAQTPIQTRILLERYLTKLNPKKVIFEVNPASFVNDGVESGLDLISNDKNTFQSVKMVFEMKHIKLLNTLIYALYNDILHREKGFKESHNKGKDKYVKGGYVESELEFYKKTNDTLVKKWEWKEKQFEELESIYQFVTSKKIELILVQAPITQTSYNSYLNNDEFDSKVKKYGNYYNYNKVKLLKDERHFEDFHHLNQLGVEIFNRHFINEVLLKK